MKAGGYLILSLSAAPAMAQQGGGEARIQPVTLVDTRPGSPSSGTATISPSSVPQNMPDIDELGPTPSRLMLSLGTLYATGDFGANSDTSIWSSAVGARIRTGPLRFTASLPYLRIRSSAAIFTGIDSTPILVAASTGRRRTAKGFGDLTLGAAYTASLAPHGPELELAGRIKLDTASRSSGLSSGKKDYAAGAQLTQPLGRVAPFVSVTYRFLGDTDAYRLRDGLAASAGASLMIGKRSYVLASYHYSERATDLVRDAHELFAGASTLIAGSRLQLTGFATAGLSRGAAGASAGLALARSF